MDISHNTESTEYMSVSDSITNFPPLPVMWCVVVVVILAGRLAVLFISKGLQHDCSP